MSKNSKLLYCIAELVYHTSDTYNLIITVNCDGFEMQFMQRL